MVRNALEAPDNVTPISLLPHSPKLTRPKGSGSTSENASRCVFEDQDAIIDACYHTCNAVADDADRIKSRANLRFS